MGLEELANMVRCEGVGNTKKRDSREIHVDQDASPSVAAEVRGNRKASLGRGERGWQGQCGKMVSGIRLWRWGHVGVDLGSLTKNIFSGPEVNVTFHVWPGRT